jgi:hypothetical protein
MAGPSPIPYPAISMMIQQGNVALFLGAAASLVGADGEKHLPDAHELAASLSLLVSYPGDAKDPLTKIAQYLVESAGDRDFLLSYIKQKFHHDVNQTYRSSLTDFLMTIPENYVPKLIVSTNYDTLIERVLEQRNIRYLAISHIIGKTPYSGRLLVYENTNTVVDKALIMTTRELEENLETVLSETSAPVILYKMHGSAILHVDTGDRQERKLHPFNSIVLTEQDYIDFLDKDVMHRLPIQIQQKLQRSRFLFLGYSLQDWNFRVLLQRIRERHSDSSLRHWACLLSQDFVEAQFWQLRGVNVYQISLDIFLSSLKDALLREPT